MMDERKRNLTGFTRMVSSMPGATSTGRTPRPTPTVAPRQQPRQYSEPVFRIQPYGPATPGPDMGAAPGRTRMSPFYDALRRMFQQKGLPERFWR